MGNLIERATQRLEQLQRAGITVPRTNADSRPSARVAESTPPGARSDARFLHKKPEAESGQRKVIVDLDTLHQAGFVTPNGPRSPLQDQYRTIKRPLIQNAMGEGAATLAHGNLIMVTSTLPGEGKTFTSINLAMSMAAELDRTVMLVDADVANPSVLRRLGIAGQVQREGGQCALGLLDVLEGRAALSDVLVRTNVEKLTLLPSGGYHSHATELLESDAMRTLLDEMATADPDRIVIFDSPPLLPTTEAAALASHMGQIVIVVQADKTLRKAVESALATIESCPVRLLLLNQSRGVADAAYGGYRSGYGYAYRNSADSAPGVRAQAGDGSPA